MSVKTIVLDAWMDEKNWIPDDNMAAGRFPPVATRALSEQFIEIETNGPPSWTLGAWMDGPDIEIQLLGETRVNQPMAAELTMLNT